MARVSLSENAEFKEFKINDDGSLSLSDLNANFNNVIGLRYRDKGSGTLRAMRICNGFFFVPIGISWLDHVFHCVCSTIKHEDDGRKKGSSLAEYYSLDTFDMFVMGIPETVSHNEFYDYFSKFGKLDLCELKKDCASKRSKGHGFLRFAKFDDQHNCMNTVHHLCGQEMHLRLPKSIDASTCSRKLLVSTITPSVTFIDLLEYFNVFGKIREFFMPQREVRYAFITFDNEDGVSNVFKLGESHRVFGGFVIVERITSRKQMEDAQIRKPQVDHIFRKIKEDCSSTQVEKQKPCPAQEIQSQPPVSVEEVEYKTHQISETNDPINRTKTFNCENGATSVDQPPPEIKKLHPKKDVHRLPDFWSCPPQVVPEPLYNPNNSNWDNPQQSATESGYRGNSSNWDNPQPTVGEPIYRANNGNRENTQPSVGEPIYRANDNNWNNSQPTVVGPAYRVNHSDRDNPQTNVGEPLYRSNNSNWANPQPNVGEPVYKANNRNQDMPPPTSQHTQPPTNWNHQSQSSQEFYPEKPRSVPTQPVIPQDHSINNWAGPMTSNHHFDHPKATYQCGGPPTKNGNTVDGTFYKGPNFGNTAEPIFGQCQQINDANNKGSSSNKMNEEGHPSEAVSDVTKHLLRKCNSQSQKMVLAKLLLDIISESAMENT